MKNLFLKYQTASGTIFCLWLLLAIFKKLGFDFGVNLSVFFRTFLFLFVIWLVWVTKIKWSEINAFIKKTWIEIKDKFIIETKETQKEIIRFFPLAFLLTIFLLLWQVIKKIFKEYVFNQITLFVLVILGILLDIFVFKFTSDLLILFLTGLWILSIYHYKFEGRVSIGGALLFLTMCPFLLIFKKNLIAEKAAVWAYMFLVVGVIQMMIEYMKEERKSAKKEE